MELAGRAVLIAAGAAYRRLEIPNLERFVGAGVFYASPAEPEPMAGARVCVLGGGNSAGQLVVHAAKHAEHVLLLVRAGSLEKGMSDYLVQEIRRLPNVEIRLNTDVVDVAGAGSLEQVVVRDRTDGTMHAVTTSALFVLIGAEPHSHWLADTVQRDRHGFLLTGADVDPADADQADAAWRQARPPTRFETSMPGVFAVGDIRHGSVKRVASAVGEGATTIQYVHEYLAGHPAGHPSASPVDSPAAPAA
jgi:thioredoxin reductase (NADPH)